MARAMRTTTFTEPKTLSEVLKWQAGDISRELVTIADSDAVLEIGTVLGKVTASGKYIAHVNGASDGSQTAVAVLAQRVDAVAADVANVVVIHRLAEVSRLGLVWHSSVDNDTKKNAAIAQLVANHIIVRNTQ